MRAAFALLAALTGCSQILGLDDTTFELRDAAADAPSSCDGAPRCTGSSGRSVCGQLYGTGDTAGQLVRVAEPTGETCVSLSSADGPCAYAVYGQSLASYYAGNMVDQIVGEIDDCGRYVVPDLDVTMSDVAIVFTGPDIVQSVTLKLDREMVAGTDSGVDAPLVGAIIPATWANQVDANNPPTIDAGYLVTYVNMGGAPIPMQELRINGGAVADPPTVPWGAYFLGDGAYGGVDPAATSTGTSGSALVVPGASSFMLGGFRTGRNCTAVPLQPHANAFIHLAMSC